MACPADSNPFGYTYAELRAIELAGKQAAHSMQKLRARDERERQWREPYVPWDAVSAGQGPNNQPKGNSDVQ